MNVQAGHTSGKANGGKPAFAALPARALLIAVGIIVLLIGFYAAAGYIWAPRLIKSQAKAWVATELKQDLAIGEVKVDPFGFKVDISGIAIPAKEPMVSIGRIHLNFAIGSVFSESYRFDTIEIDRPHVKAIIEPDGKLNLLRLVPPPSPDPFPPVLIADLNVTDGLAYLADHSRPGRPDTQLSFSGFRLENLHTVRDEGGKFRIAGASDAGEEFVWLGHVSMAPVASRGGLAIRGLKAASVQEFAGQMLPVRLNAGTIDLDISYSADYGTEGAHLWARLPKLALSGFEVAGDPKSLNADISVAAVALSGAEVKLLAPPEKDMAITASLGGVSVRNATVAGSGPASGEMVTVAAIDVGGITQRSAETPASIGSIKLAGVEVATTRAADGSFSILKMLPAKPAEATPAPAVPMPLIREFSLSDARLKLIDRAVRPISTWTVSPLTVSARPADEGTDGQLKLEVSGKLNDKTAFALNGDVSPAATSADVRVQIARFPLKAGVPYTIDFPALEIASGTASIDGRLRYGPKVTSYSGGASIDNLQLIETYQRTDLVAWRRLQLEGIAATPKKVTIERARLSRPASTVTILRDGTLNFQRLVTMNPEPVVTPAPDVTAPPPPKLTRAQRRELARREAAEKKAAAAKAHAALAAPTREPDIPVRVKRLQVDGGTFDFADYSLNPNFAAKVQGVRGSITNISNSPRTVAKVDLDGFVVDKYSPVSIEGELTPMQYDRRTHIDMAFRNIELPVFNPYSGRWAGYAIAKGKLTTELSYKIDNRALQADHHIEIAQLEWGEATDSQEKVSMPIKLITSLMKDKNGVIELDVPVTGSLDDPQFRLGPIILKIIGNLFTKIITAPFKALGGLFGDREDVQFVDFAPGSSEVPAEAAANLAELSKGLADKSELRLDIPAGPGLALDATAIADRKIAAAAMTRDVKKGEAADLATLEIAKRHDRVKDLYKARLKKGGDLPGGPENEDKDARRTREIEAMMAELRPLYAPSETELATLGVQRANAVRDAIIGGSGGITAERLFVSSRDLPVEHDGKARIELKLEGG